ncbi:hypothetical protein ACFV3I_12930 [Microbacterium sp. NPDC059771]|uniref:hypothetical protein n=2 Tax=unclassified Microbacterium TaxID=2609290 RepID=UPI003646388E
MSTKQRFISPSDLQSPEYLRVPDEAKPTAMGLWLHTDVMGRRELIPELIAGDLYPGRAATAMVEEHLLMLDDVGFLTIFPARGTHWIALARPLRVDARGARIDTPEPPSERPWTSVAVGGARAREQARERARAQVRAEDAARADAWAAVAGEREAVPAPPARPLLLDAPPIGCSEHPNGIQKVSCGPCRTARLQRDEWLARRIYEEKLATYHEELDQHGKEWGGDPF